MEYNSYKTASVSKEAAQEAKAWVVVDAEGQILGRMCTKVAKLLRGKYKPSYTPNVDCGDNVIIINAAKVQLTGNKWNDRVYVRYTGFPGGQREFTPADLLAKGADKLVRKVVKVCCLRIVWALVRLLISTSSTAQSTICRLNNPKQLILTPSNNRSTWKQLMH